MISVITCSVNAGRLKKLEQNVKDTIGVPYELIGIDNSDNRYGICEAYNIGGRRAKYDILCFIHEDILVETSNWGALIESHLADPDTGLLGIAGGDARSLVPSSWSVPIGSNEINVYQHYKFSNEQARHIVETGSAPAVKKKVAALDGVWLCTRRDVFGQFKFDEATFRAFHGYDIDYSLQVSNRFSLYVIFDIVVHHYSEGAADRKWMESAIQISKKWKTRLPVSAYPALEKEYNFHHWRSMQVFLQRLFRLKYAWPAIFYYFLYYSCNRFFRWRRFLSMGKYLFRAMRGRY